MQRQLTPAQSTEVSPLELFFDLVFVFALSQLSHHLLEDITWRGAAETAILLIAVYCVWSYTSFQGTMFNVRRPQIKLLLLVVMLLGLFMNASISDAWSDRAWAFVIPMLTCQLGQGVFTMVVAPDPQFREHYTAMLGWILASTPLWLIGAAADPENRLWWWGAAALIDLTGAWFAHPVPGVRVLRSDDVPFDGEHMLERCRLFLIIALGETVLTTGTALAHVDLDVATVAAGTFALLAIVALWAMYFAGSDNLVTNQFEETNNPIRAARLVMNAELIVVAGLITLAVGNEIVIAHPWGEPSWSLGLLLFGGALLYVLAQSWYLVMVIGRPGKPRLFGAIALVIGGVLTAVIAPVASIGLMALVLVTTAIAVIRRARVLTADAAGQAR
jgi:low temperature requirement protein LtrA